MGFNFPNTPAVNDLYPTPAQAGLPQWKWNGSEWVVAPYSPLTFVQRAGDTMTGALNVVTPPTLPAHAASKAYVDAYAVAAAPFDAMSYNGMQFNGGLDVSQERGPGGVTSLSGTYVCDGWLAAWSGPMALVVGSGPSPIFVGNGINNSIYFTVPTPQASLAANDYTFLAHSIEGYRVARLQFGLASAKPVTIGFWSAHLRTGLYSVAVRNAARDRAYVATYTQVASSVPQYNTITIPGNTAGTWNNTNGDGLNIVFAAAAGSTYTAPSTNTWLTGNYMAAPGQVNGVGAISDVFRITGVVVLPGIYAPTAAQSPLIMRPYDQELLTCQRYYQRILSFIINGWQGAGGATYETLPLPVAMRANPTVTFPGASYGNASALAVWAPASDVLMLTMNAVATGNHYAMGGINLDARL